MDRWSCWYTGNNEQADFLASSKLDPSCPVPTAMVPCSLSPTITKTHYTKYHKWTRHISRSHLNRQIPPGSPVESVLPCPLRHELSYFCCHGYSLLLLSYLPSIGHKNSFCSACWQHLQDFHHFVLDCPASGPSRKSIFGSSLHFLFLIFGQTLRCGPTVGTLHSSSSLPSTILKKKSVAPPPSTTHNLEPLG